MSVDELKMQFLQKLQIQDYLSANHIQKQLAKMVPKDPDIKEFAKYLPAEAEEQR